MQPYANYHMPHTLHCLELHPEIVLVLVEEVCMYKLCVFLVFKTREPSSNYMYDSLIKSHLSPSQLNFYASQYTYARAPVCVYTYAHTHIHTYMQVCVSVYVE